MLKLQRLLIGLALLALLPVGADAQVPALDRGSWILGGGASLTSSGGDGSDERSTALSLSPSVQYFVLPGLALGADISLAHTASGDFSNTGWGIGPVATYYWVRDGQAHPFVSAGARYASSKSELDDDLIGGEQESTQIQYRAAAGILFLLSDAVGFDTRVYYQRQEYDFDDEVEFDTDQFGLAVGISAFLF